MPEEEMGIPPIGPAIEHIGPIGLMLDIGPAIDIGGPLIEDIGIGPLGPIPMWPIGPPMCPPGPIGPP